MSTLNKLMWRAARFLFTVTLLLSLLFLVPAAQAQTFTITFNIDGASVDKLGIVHVYTTLSCSETVIGEIGMSAFVRQPVRRNYSVTGQGSHGPISECSGTNHYIIDVMADAGKFGSGIAYIDAGVAVCDVNLNCVSNYTSLYTRIH